MLSRDEQNQQNSENEKFNSLEDNELIRRILKGEKNLYSLIIRKYNQRLYRVGLSIMNNDQDVEDVMQIAYIKAYENLDKFKFLSGFSTWLTKILVNESLMFLKKRRQAIAREKIQTSPERNHGAIENQTPLMQLLNSELKTVLETSIRELPEKYRTVFIMRELENMTVSETMECLDLTEANVKIRLNRAKLMLRDKIRAYLKDDEILQLYKTHCDQMVDMVMGKIIKAHKQID
jgi:RNA polymerase sigma factor (sigma-70 family)